MSRFSVPVTTEQKSILEDMAAESNLSIARVLQEAVKEFIERHPERALRLLDYAKQETQ